MSKIDDIVIGLEIFKKYGGEDCCAEHDEFYSGPSGKIAMSMDDIVKLMNAGWAVDATNCGGCAEEGDADDDTFLADPDDPGTETKHRRTCEYWSIFT